jgi:MEMO1 family protein
MDYPKLRDGLEAIPVMQGSQHFILLRDALGYSSQPLLLSESLAPVLTHMTGQNSMRDLQLCYLRATGQLLFSEQLEEILAKLDEHLFLDSERFTEYVAREVTRFREAAVRPMQHAGVSYPLEAESARSELESYFTPRQNDGELPEEVSAPGRLVGLVAPHIDIKAGGGCFADAYRALSATSAPDVWIILGTGHYPAENYFAVTRKDFATPFGPVRCDREFCDDLLRQAPRDLLASEYNHHREHTIEFQALFLGYLQPAARIVPILCSFSVDDWEEDRDYIDHIAALLSELAESRGRSVGFIASVDLAHIGPRYGDSFQPHAGTLAQHMAADRDLLQCLEQCDAVGFLQKIQRDQNQRRICGMAPLYVFAKALGSQAKGILLHHAHATVDARQSFVTFASMAFHSIR